MVPRRPLAIVVISVLCLFGGATTASAGTLPPGFQETTAFSGLEAPTVFRFAPDGRVFVAEKSGLIKVFDGMGDPSASVYADLRTQVHNFWDRGMLGMVLDYWWDDYPWIYVMYTHDAAIGQTAPRWGTAGETWDGCPNPPGATGDGCVVSGRVSRLRLLGDQTVQEDVLIEDWCQQYPSHSIGSLEMDQWGAIYASGGDGASFGFLDYGQDGNPLNPCGDPPGGVGATMAPPSAEGGSLRSQDLRTPGDPVTLDGTIIRIHSDGAPAPTNPLYGSSDPNARRIIATGLRNPFRFTLSNSDEVWIGDVGAGTWEEVNSFPAYNRFVSGPFNFGWPCYEGPARYGGFDNLNLSICENLYGSGQARAPYFAYNHGSGVVPGEGCATGSSSISGMEFYYGTAFPSEYRDALFFADYSRDCIWVMRAGADGSPDRSTVETFDAGASGPVYMQEGPDGALYYLDLNNGAIKRIGYTSGNQAPVAVADASPRNGAAPLTVNLSATASSDPEGDPLSYAWDLDGDQQFDDSTSATPTYVFSSAGTYTPTLEVTDDEGATSRASVVIDVGNTPPVPAINGPAPGTTWTVGKQIAFSGSAGDAQDGQLPASALDWTLTLHHCPSNCHQHPLQGFPDRAAGSFAAPDHEYPSHLELTLTATDSGGLTATRRVRLHPRTVNLTLASTPTGPSLALNALTAKAPFTRAVIRGSANTISAPSPQILGGYRYNWLYWSDGGSRTHNVTASSSRTLTATFRRRRASTGRAAGGAAGFGASTRAWTS